MDSMKRLGIGPDVGAADIRGQDISRHDDTSQRKRGRDSLFLMAQLQVGSDPTIREVRIRNLSEGGVMAELDRAVAVGTPVRLDIRGIGDIGGKVAWCIEGRLGIALDETIDPKRARKPVGTGPRTPFYAKATPRG